MNADLATKAAHNALDLVLTSGSLGGLVHTGRFVKEGCPAHIPIGRFDKEGCPAPIPIGRFDEEDFCWV